MKWFATRLHVFVFVATVEQGVGVQLAQGFTKAGVDYAKANKRGLPIGLQTGVATISMLVSSNIDQQARSWAEQRPPRDFGAFATPVLVNSATGERHTYTGRIVWGASYTRFLRELVNESVDAALGGRPA